jgi:hypothetical protein
MVGYAMRALDVLLGSTTYRILPVNHPLAERWLDAVVAALNNGLRPEPDFCFLGFPQGPRTLEVLCQELAGHIAVINAQYPDFHIVAADFSPETVRLPNGLMNRATLNRLHRHFEELQGPTGKASDYYSFGTSKTREAICRLNWICHEIENRIIGEKRMALGQVDDVSAAQVTVFHHSPTFNLQPDDYNLFTLDREPGDVFLNYPIVGKTAFAALCDRDIGPDERAERFAPHTLGSASFDVEFGRWAAPNRITQGIRRDEFAALCERLGLDPRQHGFLKIGHIDLARQFPERDFAGVQALLSQNLRITGMQVVDVDTGQIEARASWT